MARAMEPDEPDGTCDDFSVDQVKNVARPCPLCFEPIVVCEQVGPQRVVCGACGLSCTVDASPPPPRLAMVMLSPQDAADDEDGVVHWLERAPGPVLPDSDLSAEVRKARRRRLALGAMSLALLLLCAGVSAWLAYVRTSDRLARRTAAERIRLRQNEAQLLASQQLLEHGRRAAEQKRQHAEREVRLVTAKYLAAQARVAAADSPWRGVALAAQAVNTTLAPDRLLVSEAHQSLRDALAGCADAHRIDGITLEGHGAAITAIAASPDGRWLATGSLDHTIRLWDLRSRSPQESPIVLKRHTARVTKVVFSSDSRWLVSGSLDSSACVWDLAALSPENPPIVLPGRGRPIHDMALSASGRWLATITASTHNDLGMARLWDLGADGPHATSLELTDQGSPIRAVAISPDSRWLAIGVGHGVRLWNLNSRVPAVASLDRRCDHGSVSSALFTNDGRWLITCGAGPGAPGSKGTAQLWSLAADDPSTSIVLRGHTGAVRALSASPDGRWLVTAGGDEAIRLWDLHAANPSADPFALAVGSSHVTAAALSPNGRWLAASAEDGAVRLWSISPQGPEAPAVVLRSVGALSALTFTADSRWLAAAGAERTIRLWNLDIGELVRKASRIAWANGQRVAPRFSWVTSCGAIVRNELRQVIRPQQYVALWEAVRPHAAELEQQAKALLAMATSRDVSETRAETAAVAVDAKTVLPVIELSMPATRNARYGPPAAMEPSSTIIVPSTEYLPTKLAEDKRADVVSAVTEATVKAMANKSTAAPVRVTPTSPGAVPAPIRRGRPNPASTNDARRR